MATVTSGETQDEQGDDVAQMNDLTCYILNLLTYSPPKSDPSFKTQLQVWPH